MRDPQGHGWGRAGPEAAVPLCFIPRRAQPTSAHAEQTELSFTFFHHKCRKCLHFQGKYLCVHRVHSGTNGTHGLRQTRVSPARPEGVRASVPRARTWRLRGARGGIWGRRAASLFLEKGGRVGMVGPVLVSTQDPGLLSPRHPQGLGGRARSPPSLARGTRGPPPPRTGSRAARAGGRRGAPPGRAARTSRPAPSSPSPGSMAPAHVASVVTQITATAAPGGAGSSRPRQPCEVRVRNGFQDQTARGGARRAGPGHLSSGHPSPGHLSPGHLSPRHLSPKHLSPEHLSPEHLSSGHLSSEAGPLRAGELRAGHQPQSRG